MPFHPPRPALLRRSLAVALLAGATTAGPAPADIVSVPTCDGKPATHYRGSGKPGTDGAAGSPMKVYGTKNADVIVGDTGNDILRGAGGDDTICGGGANDQLLDGAGADWVDGEGGDDRLFAGPGTDRMAGGDGTDGVSYEWRTADLRVTLQDTSDNGDVLAGEDDTIVGDVENAQGGKGADTLIGSGGPNVLRGGAGADTIKGFDGNDKIFDGPDADTVEGGNQDDTLVAGLGRDQLSGGDGTDLVTYADRTDGVIVVLAADSPAPEDHLASLENNRPDIENARGGSGDDIVVGNEQANVIHGYAGTDVIGGLAGDDVLHDGAGDDKVYGDEPDTETVVGDDLLIAGSGADAYDGGPGFDRISYRARTAPITVEIGGGPGSSGENNGGEGDKVDASVEGAHGGSAGDTLTGDDGPNKLWGGPGDGEDMLFGVGGGDTLYGEGGADYLVDGGGADELFGMTGDDDLHIGNDGAVDSAHCGDGDDAVADGAGGVDPTDSVDPDCESVTRPDPDEEL